MSEKNVVDSACWLEFFADTKLGAHYAEAIENTGQLLVPVISIYEVYKKVLRERGRNAALEAASMMQSGQVIDVDTSLALDAADHGLPLADSLIYATARRHRATLWTQDAHFKDLPGVRYFAQPSSI